LSNELTDDQVEALFEIVDIRRLTKGEVLISEGEYDDHLYAIAKGEFEVTRGKTDDREVQLIRLHPGTITGELAFLDGLQRTATVTATEDGSCVIALRRAGLEGKLTEDPVLVYRLMRAILRSAHRTVGQMDATYLDMMRYIQG
jgi:CRP-like cAMP-binding protein